MNYIKYNNLNKVRWGKYWAIYLPKHPNSFANGYVYEHRVVASNMLGRFLKDEEFVHHKDEDGHNNSPDNLMIFASNSDHAAFHSGAEIYEKDRLYYAKKKSRKNYCKDCGIEISRQSMRCVGCYNKNKENKSSCPDRNTLKNLIRYNNFVFIGKAYNVSSKTVEKWCIKHNLPSKSRIIKTISDEEWDLI